ncbi:MAG: AMP-binding protein, partial [Pseudobdellovibrionaceae bacterium]
MNSTLFNHLGECILAMPQRSLAINSSIAATFKQQDAWVEKSWNDYYLDIQSAGGALLKLNLQLGDRVAIMCNTRYEWSVLDLAILGLQGVTVPIYPNNTAQEVEFILNHSESSILFIENK